MPFIREYVGASRFEDGEMGLVPPALAGEQDYILTGAGKWVPNTGGGVYELPIATKTELGGIKIGEGLEISEDGTLTVIGGGTGSNCVTDVDLKQDAPGVIVVTKPNETKELDVFQYMTELEINCVEDATI